MSASSGSTINATILALPRALAASVFATAGVTLRGLGGKNTRPTKSAPPASAASSAASVFRPQILTLVGMGLLAWVLVSKDGE